MPIEWDVHEMFAMSVAGWMMVTSAIAAVMYIWDKRQAQKNKSRISERTLLVCSALGGWPGAMLVGRTIRHKTQKLPYRIKFAFCVIFNLAVVLLLWYFQTQS